MNNKNNSARQNKFNRGQIAIIVLLVSAVVLTIGLSSSRKAITDLKVDTNEELLKEAFNTAESGINNYLSSGNKTYTGSNSSGASVSVTTIGGENSLSSEGLVQDGSNQLFWLVNHDENDNIETGDDDYYSGDTILIKSSKNNVALKIDYFYIDDGGIYQVYRRICKYSGFDASNISDKADFINDCSSGFTLPTSVGNSLLLSITPIGGATEITIIGSANFPAQGEELTSVGTANNGVNTQIKTRNTYQIPSFLTEAIVARNVIK